MGGNVPTTSEVLGETCNVAAVGVHHTEVTIGLQERCSKLCAGFYGSGLRIVGIHFFHVAIAASGKAQCCDGQQYIYLFHNWLLRLEFYVDIETIATA